MPVEKLHALKTTCSAHLSTSDLGYSRRTSAVLNWLLYVDQLLVLLSEDIGGLVFLNNSSTSPYLHLFTAK